MSHTVHYATGGARVGKAERDLRRLPWAIHDDREAVAF